MKKGTPLTFLLLVCLLLSLPAAASAAAPPVRDESVIKAIILLDQDGQFQYFRNSESVVENLMDQIDADARASAAIYYGLGHYLEAIYSSQKTLGWYNPVEITMVEFYECILLDMLGYTSPDLLDVPWAPKEADVALYFSEMNLEILTEADQETFGGIFDLLFGDDSHAGFGLLDAFLAEGKSLDAFVTQLAELASLLQVTDGQVQALEVMEEQTDDRALKEAISRVSESIALAREKSLDQWLSQGAGQRVDVMMRTAMETMVEYLYSLHPAVKILHLSAEGTQIILNETLAVEDLSTDILRMVSMMKVEDLLRACLDETEQRFRSQETGETARTLMTLAELYRSALLTGCDLGTSFAQHAGHGKDVQDALVLADTLLSRPLEPSEVLACLVRGSEDPHEDTLKAIASIRRSIETADFYGQSSDALAYIRQVVSTTPSPWAAEEVRKAIDLEILPEDMCYNYQSNITRLEFCALLEYMIDAKTDKTTLEWVDEVGTPLKEPFDDAMYVWANDIARLGIINGVGNNQLNPLGEITRQEAATMLYRTAAILGYDTTSYDTNHLGVAQWAEAGVNFVSTQGIMKGTGQGFSPTDPYTKEQAIITMVRFFENVQVEWTPPQTSQRSAPEAFYDFLQADGHLEAIRDWWCEASLYLLLDINQDGTQELILAGDTGIDFLCYEVFVYNSLSDTVTWASRDVYSMVFAGLSYSSQYKALVYRDMRPYYIGQAAIGGFGYYDLQGDTLTWLMTVGNQEDPNGGGFFRFLEIPGQGQRRLTEDEFWTYWGDAESLTLAPLSDLGPTG